MENSAQANPRHNSQSPYKIIPISIKYLDPSYRIRSVAKKTADTVLCHLLAEYAVHAGMSGKTNHVVGYWINLFKNVRIILATDDRRMVDLEGAPWRRMMSATRQDN
ncbi:6-phosphofructokinase [Synechococcus sp. A18-25c]|uniref:hypothetical protein n=1 Tax=Synechococcus sp. A18-25c TaxID=1866938 RepID=UPI0016458DB7|nr:hypothetical protein [Synechococcus sp. A18-25c]QNJ21125.1 6-phosphofructokinase [Synechococcus sp. A18-25c]